MVGPVHGGRGRRILTRIAALALGWAGAACSGGGADTEAPGAAPLAGRDVLVIVCDSVHAAHLSSYGNPRPTTPALDRLAERGVRFENAYSQTAWTLPSVASLFTSEEQEVHGLVRNGLRLGDEPNTLAELFGRAGYRTLAFIQNGTLGARTGLDRGFDDYVVEPSTEACLKRVREAFRSEQPVFVYAHLLPPHMPYVPQPQHAGRFDPDYDGPIVGSVDDCRALGRSGAAPTDADVRHLEALYDEFLATIDEHLGYLIARVAPEGREGAVVIFTSDHGEAFLQHGRQGHGPHVYEEMVRVPLILAAEGAPWAPGRVVDTPAGILDVLPTLVELVGLPTPRQRVRGRSLLRLATGAAEGEEEREAFFSSRFVEGVAGQVGMRRGRWKWILDRDADAAYLFDLSADPGEEEDLAAARPEVARALRERTEAWLREVGELRAERAPAEEFRPTDAMLEAMEALGYAGDGR